MANETIPDLPAVVNLNANAQLWAVQAGADVRVGISQIIALVPMVTGVITVEQLTVSALNTVNNLTFAPKNGLVILFINGQAFFNVGAASTFTLAVETITWTSSAYSIQTTDTVYAVYGV